MLKKLTIVLALMLMSAASFSAFAQHVTITPTSQTVVQGGDAEYEIIAPGFPNGYTLTLNWCTSSGGKAGVPSGVIPNSPAPIVNTNALLRITTAATTPPGTYYFQLLDRGKPVSNIASLTVTAAPTVSGIKIKWDPDFLTQIAGQCLLLNGLTATLTYSNGTKEDVYVWNFGEKEIKTTINGVPVSHGIGGTVLSMAHNGRPITVACNGHSADTKPLTIVDPPTIHTHPVSQSVVAGGTVSFTVGATASAGTLSYHWQVSPKGSSEWDYVDGYGVLASVFYSGHYSNELTLTNVPVSLDGYRFRCKVTNLLGSAGYYFYSDSATLTVSSASATTYAVTVTANYRDAVGNAEVASPTIATYPNPVGDVLYFSLETAFEIIDMQGRTLLKSDRAAKSTNVGQLRPGLYFVRTGNVVHKIIKK